MASKLEEDLTCPICCDIYTNPVIMPCSHSVCKACLQQFWEIKGSRECPCCRRKYSKKKFPLNIALRNLCETFLRERSEGALGSEVLCSEHGEKLKLFCREDKQPVCLLCRDSNKHNGHTFQPIHEAATGFKEALTSIANNLQKSQEAYKEVKLLADQMAQHIKTQVISTEKQIKQEFEKLHQFLRDEETARIDALKEEEEWRSEMMAGNIEDINKEISYLCDSIRSMKEEIGRDDITFLQNYKSTEEQSRNAVIRVLVPSSSTQLIDARFLEALLDVAKHLGNLKFRVCEKMQSTLQHSSVILDPNTAHPQLILSEDLTSVRLSCEGIWEPLPFNPERFSASISVLGSEGFDSGIHQWEVEVEDNRNWIIGVAESNVDRKLAKSFLGDFDQSSWYIKCSGSTCTAYPTALSAETASKLKGLKKVRVDLNCDTREVTYSDVSGALLHTQTYPADKTVFPYFGSIYSSLKVFPCEPKVQVGLPPKKHNFMERIWNFWNIFS